MCDVHILWPENKIVSGERVLLWYSDAVTNGECEDRGETEDPMAAARILDEAGLITLARTR